MSPRRGVVGLVLCAVLVAVALSVHLASRARGADASRCDVFAAASAQRAEQVTGSGRRVLVIGDSWSAGLGLTRPVDAWPRRLPGRVHVAAFSGSGFSAHASGCGRVSYADRASAALVGGTDLVVVQGGLNDVDRPTAEIRAGFDRLALRLASYDVVVVGPALAPSRAAAVPRVDRLLAAEARRYGLPYIATSDLRLPYGSDGLHLTAAGQQSYGRTVADRIAALG